MMGGSSSRILAYIISRNFPEALYSSYFLLKLCLLLRIWLKAVEICGCGVEQHTLYVLLLSLFCFDLCKQF